MQVLMPSPIPSKSMNLLRSYECTVKGCDWRGTIVNARSAGQAKRQYLLDLDGCYPDVKFTDIRCRVNGKPHSSDQFVQTAIYRGLPALKCGDKVDVKGNKGVIVGHNPSANFEVLFDDDNPEYKGVRLSVHPSEMKIA